MTCAAVFPSIEAARAVPRGRVELRCCQHCGLVHNPWFDAALAEIGARYESSQTASGHFGRFARALAGDWVQRHALGGKRVVEVGCGSGDFLRLLRGAGVGTACGLDPLAPPGRRDDIEFIAGRFDAAAADTLDANALVCRHTLEHVADVAGFVAALARWARRDPARVVLLEVPATERILAEIAFWDIYYEHANYFTADVLRARFEAAGMLVHRVETVYDGQYLLLEASARAGAATMAPAAPDASAVVAACRRFGADARAAIERCDRALDALAARGPVVLWQAASKTVGLLSAVGRPERVVAAVDLNERRHGHYLPDSGLPIVAPEALSALAPASIVLLNPVYEQEVAARLQQLGCAAPLLTVDRLLAPAAGGMTTSP